MIAILDDRDIALSNASVQFCSDPRAIALAGVDERALLGYYFARGRRRVVIDLGAVQLRGRLDTRWDGNHRRWFVRTDVAAIVPATLKAASPDAEPPLATPATTRLLAIAS